MASPLWSWKSREGATDGERGVAYYLVTATPRQDLLTELQARLDRDEFAVLRPFGKALSGSLRRARLLPNGKAMWEEEDYCTPPLAQEREAVLDRYFDGLSVEPVVEGTGWTLIDGFPALFPGLARRRPGVAGDPTGQ